MAIKIQKLREDAVIPKRAKKGDAGLDLVAVEVNHDNPKYSEYRTGLAFEIPEGKVGLLFPRSSVSNYDMALCNCVGVLDAGFRGEVTFRYRRNKAFGDFYKVGERIGQLLIVDIDTEDPIVVDKLSSSERGTGGYGSSGN